MSVSFEGVGQVCATFLGGKLTEGQVVKLTGSGTVGACSAGDSFIGAALCCKDDACTVQVGGFVTVSYTGTAPTVGWCALTADGNGGVKAAAAEAAALEEAGGSGTAGGGKTENSRMLPVVSVDTTAKTATILL